MNFRKFAFGLTTLLGFRRRGYFIPYRYAGSEDDTTREPYAAIAALFDRRLSHFGGVLDRIEAHGAALRAIGSAPPPDPRWNQDWFPRLDAAAAYAMTKDLAPKLIVEIGSGHSTRFMARAIRDGGLATKLVAIDPAPRATLDGLPIELCRKTLDHAPAEIFRGLGTGDVLFVDSSHILMPGSDVDTVLNHILPTLAPGVVLHFHDIFLPEAYPREWTWRGYNEQLGVAAMLLSGGYDVLFASRFVATQLKERVERGVLGHMPLPTGAYESSLWLRKTAASIGPR